MTVPTIRISRSPARPTAFSYLWLSYVRGFDPREHCLKSLVGKKSRRVHYRRMEPGVDIRLDEDEPATVARAGYRFLYLCGSIGDYASNLHVAMVPSPGGAVIHRMVNDAIFTLRHVAEVPIPEIKAGWRGFPLKWTSCRNWRFGVEYFGCPEGTRPRLAREWE